MMAYMKNLTRFYFVIVDIEYLYILCTLYISEVFQNKFKLSPKSVTT